ncbi:MAG: cyclase family protein [Acidobacteriota bacterium]
MTGRILDLSHAIEDGMITYPGLPVPRIGEHLSREASKAKYAAGTTFAISSIELVGNTGTYIDAPLHRFAEGADLASLPLERIAGVPGAAIDARSAGRAIGPEAFSGIEVAGRAILFSTGWDAHWRTPRYGAGEHPYLTRAAAEALVRGGAALVGIDSLNIDDASDGQRPAHTALLRAGIPILEHLCRLSELPPSGFRVHAVPAPWRGVTSFPVRAYAMLPDESA